MPMHRASSRNRLKCLVAWSLLTAGAVLAAACGGGGGSGSTNPPPPPPPPPPDRVTISGTVSYDFVPVGGSLPGLNYPETEVRPARLVTVQFIDTGAALAVTRTDLDGHYSFEVDANRQGFIRVRAESRGGDGNASWLFRVLDNTADDAIYTLDGAVESSGDSDSRRDLHAASGWNGTGYGGERAAAPFAILDTVFVGVEMVLTADPTTDFPPLDIHWSPNNVPTFGADGNPDPDTGEIGSSRYAQNIQLGMDGIYLLGAEDADTEEYDRHVILHEFAHYLEAEIGRNDSIGGPHSIFDALDFRVAFSEGWATAFAGIVLGDPAYRDTSGSQQLGSFGFDIEGGPSFLRGGFEERAVFEIVYDLFDSNVDLAMNDTLAYPFVDIWAALTGPVTTTPAFTSIYPFLNAIKAGHPADQMQIDALASVQGIASITTDFGVNETNDAGSTDVLPIYAELEVNGPIVNLCSTDEFRSFVTGMTNKLGSRRFARFTPPAVGSFMITATATSIPLDEATGEQNYSDPDFLVYRNGTLIFPSIFPPSDACKLVDDPTWVPGNCLETSTLPLGNAEYVLDLHEWTNTNADDDADYPPIGRTCFDLAVTQL